MPSLYVVCEERANHSRIHYGICAHRCENCATCLWFAIKTSELREAGIAYNKERRCYEAAD